LVLLVGVDVDVDVNVFDLLTGHCDDSDTIARGACFTGQPPPGEGVPVPVSVTTAGGLSGLEPTDPILEIMANDK
jgi:hypothetical protein